MPPPEGCGAPVEAHYGLAAAAATNRSRVLATARAADPEHFATTTDPEILTSPSTAWINKPADNTAIELAA